MSYQQYGSIQASDFNTLVTDFNTVYGSGSGNSGYGQTSLGSVTAGNRVTYEDWNSLVTKIKALANHQNSATTAINNLVAPTAGDSISYLSGLSGGITTITSNRLNASAQGTSYSAGTASTSTWRDYVTFTSTVTFASAAAARYFFNAGGQIALTPYHPNGSGINSLFYALSQAIGTIKFSSQSGVTIAGMAFNGTTKIGGSGALGSEYTISSNTGFYNLLTTDTEICRQNATGALSKYLTSNISINARIDATGTILRFTTTFDSNWSSGGGLTVGTGTNVTCSVIPPATTYLTNTWGTPGVTSAPSMFGL